MAIDYVLAWGKVCLLLPVMYWSLSGKEHMGSRSVRISSGCTCNHTRPKDHSFSLSLKQQCVFLGADLYRYQERYRPLPGAPNIDQLYVWIWDMCYNSKSNTWNNLKKCPDHTYLSLSARSHCKHHSSKDRCTVFRSWETQGSFLDQNDCHSYFTAQCVSDHNCCRIPNTVSAKGIMDGWQQQLFSILISG